MGNQVIAFCSTLILAALLQAPLAAQPTATPLEVANELPLFVIEIKTGAKWDASKPPQEQAFFREHSANLRRLREAGSLLLGARYSDKGLLVVAAPALADARAMMDPDPSIAAGTFSFEVHPFNVFYSGALQVRRPR